MLFITKNRNEFTVNSDSRNEYETTKLPPPTLSKFGETPKGYLLLGYKGL
jgi:hypothetical protein